MPSRLLGPNVMDKPTMAALLRGTQGGPRPDARMSGEPDFPLPVRGLDGAQSGHYEEGWPVTIARFGQAALGAAPVLPGAVVGYGIGESLAGPIGGAFGAMKGAELGGKIGEPVVRNAVEAKPDDVWLHKVDQYLRRKWRGLE